MGMELALLVPASELTQARREPLRLATREVAPEDTDQRRALEKREVERQLGNVAGSKAHDQQPAAPGERAERRLAVRSSHRVVDDVQAFSAGEGLDLLAEILARVVDGR